MPMTIQTPRIAVRDTTLNGLLDKPAKANQVRCDLESVQVSCQGVCGEWSKGFGGHDKK